MKRIAFIYSAVMAGPLDMDEWKVIDRVVARIEKGSKGPPRDQNSRWPDQGPKMYQKKR